MEDFTKNHEELRAENLVKQSKETDEAKKAFIEEMLSKDEADNIEMEDPETCCHHWILPIAEGPVSKGICKKCGIDKSFFNSNEFSYRGGSRPIGGAQDGSITVTPVEELEEVLDD